MRHPPGTAIGASRRASHPGCGTSPADEQRTPDKTTLDVIDLDGVKDAGLTGAPPLPRQTIPNLVAVKIGTAGQISFANAVGATDVIFDVVGYFTAT